MPTCPDCHQSHVHGEIICPHCGADLEAQPTEDPCRRVLFLPVEGVNRGLAVAQTCIVVHVIRVDDIDFREGTFVALIPLPRLEIPVRIGRKDLRQSPPIVPELDLTPVLSNVQPDVRPVVSRLHAVLQLDAGRPAIKALAHATTWIRHTGEDQLSPVPPNMVRLLQNRDLIVLGYPRSRHVRLRVVLSRP